MATTDPADTKKPRQRRASTNPISDGVSVTKAAQILGVSAETLRRMDRRGDGSPSIKKGARRVYTSDDLTRFRELLSGRRRKVCTTISLVNQKGGVGKTTISINLGG